LRVEEAREKIQPSKVQPQRPTSSN
jgi:hypothetical protein